MQLKDYQLKIRYNNRMNKFGDAEAFTPRQITDIRPGDKKKYGLVTRTHFDYLTMKDPIDFKKKGVQGSKFKLLTKRGAKPNPPVGFYNNTKRNFYKRPVNCIFNKEHLSSRFDLPLCSRLSNHPLQNLHTRSVSVKQISTK